MDSNLGESCASLTNVQLPSWSHASVCGIRTNAKMGLSCERALLNDTLTTAESHKMFNPVQQEAQLLSELP